MIPTQCPEYTATRLLRGVQHKARTAYLGLVRGRKPQDRLLGASFEQSDIVSGLPQQAITVPQAIHHATLAASIAARWEELTREIRKQEAQ